MVYLFCQNHLSYSPVLLDTASSKDRILLLASKSRAREIFQILAQECACVYLPTYLPTCLCVITPSTKDRYRRKRTIERTSSIHF